MISLGSAPLERVLRTHELDTRAPRMADHAQESRALVGLAKTLADDPRRILEALAQATLQLCSAGSTGLSILDSETGGDPKLFRWRALAGAWADKYLGATLPRDFSPCGVVLSRNSVQLMTEPAEYYPYVGEIQPPCHEVLLIPFGMGAEPVGTIWAVMHEPGRHFDAEDARLLSSLAQFASAGYQSLKHVEAVEEYGRARTSEVRDLTDANKIKDEFIATIAHELRNSLGPIRHTSSIFKHPAASASALKQASDVLERQSASMARLVDDLLDVSRLRMGVLELNPARVDVGAALRAAYAESHLSRMQNSRVVEIDIPAHPIYLNGDSFRLAQIFGNLLNNAAKYTESQGSICVRLSAEPGEAVISVSDDGIGIAPDQMNSIFDLFAQAGQAGTPRSAGGLGIGLHLAKQLVEAHNGSIVASSEGAGRGSQFTVRLPLLGAR